ncbi:hypothetical protein JKP88DRAFT_306722 [Tribonema minus]|uniref:Uncharacterized protein n=1 Tax=Tribonema minus TaxID=303371 RepID=A0A836CJK8_9STRA|nr:hypothetical protein JKP88DRAFT_306722 [Tribonema minus]
MDSSSSLPLRGDGRPRRNRQMTAKLSAVEAGEVCMPSPWFGRDSAVRTSAARTARCQEAGQGQEHVIAPDIVSDQDVLIDSIKSADTASLSAAEHAVAARLIMQAIARFLPSDQRRYLVVTAVPARNPCHQPFRALVEAVIRGLPDELRKRVRFVQLLQRKHFVPQHSALPAADRAQRTDVDAADAAALEAAHRTSLPRGAALFAPAAVWIELRAADGAPGAYLHPDTELGRCIGSMRQWLPGSPNLEANWRSEAEQQTLSEQAPIRDREVCRCILVGCSRTCELPQIAAGHHAIVIVAVGGLQCEKQARQGRPGPASNRFGQV